MKRIFSIFLLLLVTYCFAGSFMIGGKIPVINRVSEIGIINFDFSENKVKETIAIFIVDNNTPSYELTLTFENGGNFVNKENKDTIKPYELIITQGDGGLLGTGIIPLINVDLLPILAISDDIFIWKPENQTTATVNYQLKILASFNTINKLAGLYQETIITNIKADF